MLWPKVFYLAADGKMTAVTVLRVREPKPSFVPGSPVALFDSHSRRDLLKISARAGAELWLA